MWSLFGWCWVSELEEGYRGAGTQTSEERALLGWGWGLWSGGHVEAGLQEVEEERLKSAAAIGRNHPYQGKEAQLG